MSVTHKKHDSLTDWTQAQLNEAIAAGRFPIGTTLAMIVLPSDWNDSHNVAIGIADLTATGTPGATNFLRGDNTWAVPAGGSGITRSVSSIAINTNAAAAASTDYVYYCTATLTFTLPTPVGNTNRYTVVNQGAASTITLATAAGAINGNVPLTQQYMSYDLISDGTNWNIV